MVSVTRRHPTPCQIVSRTGGAAGAARSSEVPPGRSVRVGRTACAQVGTALVTRSLEHTVSGDHRSTRVGRAAAGGSQSVFDSKKRRTIMANLTITRRRRPLSSWFDEMFEDFFVPVSGSASRQGLPAMNVAETPEAYVLAFELPGVNEDSVNVQIDEGQLVLSAERKFETEKREGVEFHRVEHRYGTFARSVALPKDVLTESIEATFKQGVLTVTVPKAEPTVARRIEIKTS
jgi:HSP20 family protein